MGLLTDAFPGSVCTPVTPISGPESAGRYNVLCMAVAASTFHRIIPGRTFPIPVRPECRQDFIGGGRYSSLPRHGTIFHPATACKISRLPIRIAAHGRWRMKRYKGEHGRRPYRRLWGWRPPRRMKASSGTWTSLAGDIEAQPGGVAGHITYSRGLAGLLEGD